MRFIYNNQVYMLDNSNKQFKIFDLSIDTFNSDVFQTLDYKKATPALKKFINGNRVYLYGDLFKPNQIQLSGPTQTTLQTFIHSDYVNFVNEQVYYVQRKIDGFHSQIYVLDKAIPFETLIETSFDETFLEKENLFECEYLNGKYYVFIILREKSESCLEMNIAENFKLCQKYIPQTISVDFKIKDADKRSNLIMVGNVETKKKTSSDWVNYFKMLLNAKTSSTIQTDGFVLYKSNTTVGQRIMFKVKPTDNTSSEFILKWDERKQQYLVITVGTYRDFTLTNANFFTKSEPKTIHAKLGGCEFEFKLPFYLNTMSHIYKPKLDDPLGQIALKGELDGKYCECAWHKYNDADPYPSRIVPQKVRFEVQKISHFVTSIRCYIGSLISFSNATEEQIEDLKLYIDYQDKNYLDLYAGNNIQQKSKPTMFVYQGSSKNFLAGLKDMTAYQFVYIFQESLALQINTLIYVREQMMNALKEHKRNADLKSKDSKSKQTSKNKSSKSKHLKKEQIEDEQIDNEEDIQEEDVQNDDQQEDLQNDDQNDKQQDNAQQDNTQRMALFPNWYMFQRNKLQQIIMRQPSFDVLRIEDSFDDLLYNPDSINTFDIIAHSAKVVQVIDTKNVVKESLFEEYLLKTYKLSKTVNEYEREVQMYVRKGEKGEKSVREKSVREKSVREKSVREKNLKREKHNAHEKDAQTSHDTGDHKKNAHKKDSHKKSKSKKDIVITIDDKKV